MLAGHVNCLLVGVQNGMTTDTIAEIVGSERTIGCVIEISSMMFNPGVVMRHSAPARSWFAVSGVDVVTRGREHEVADLLRSSGTVEIVDDIQATKWMKLVSNATTFASTALVGLSMHEAVAVPGMRELMLQAGQEALDVGAALRHPVLPIFGMKPDELRLSNRLVETMLDKLLAGFTLPHTKSTVLQDWMKGRRSEVDDLNGLVVAKAARLGRMAPVNTAIAEMANR